MFVGELLGAGVGSWVGRGVGVDVGTEVGVGVGILVGEADGSLICTSGKEIFICFPSDRCLSSSGTSRSNTTTVLCPYGSVSGPTTVAPQAVTSDQSVCSHPL